MSQCPFFQSFKKWPNRLLLFSLWNSLSALSSRALRNERFANGEATMEESQCPFFQSFKKLMMTRSIMLMPKVSVPFLPELYEIHWSTVARRLNACLSALSSRALWNIKKTQKRVIFYCLSALSSRALWNNLSYYNDPVAAKGLSALSSRALWNFRILSSPESVKSASTVKSQCPFFQSFMKY
mgnify:CR=1 FL=1